MPRSHDHNKDKTYYSTGTAIGGEVLIGKDPVFLDVLDKARKLARTDLSILLQGETGTGKGCVARAIHYWSCRSAGPFILADCNELPPSLAESALFGHVRGAFTGADCDRPGIIKGADHGTLFIDELDSLPLQLQAKLLRVTDTGEFRPVGSTHSSKVDLRLISAAGTRLSRTSPGEFRPDLLYRVAQSSIVLPPLRERPSDIPMLAAHFLELAQIKGISKCRRSLSPDCLRTILAFDWPGNVRQLANVIQEAAAVGRGEVIECRDLSIPQITQTSNAMRDLQKEHQASEERENLHSLLHRSGGDIHRAAVEACVSVRTLYRRVKTHSLDLRIYRQI